MTADLNELGLNDDLVDVEAGELPEERSARLPMLQPILGIYWQLPSSFDFEKFQVDTGQRIYARFKDATALRTHPGGIPVRATVSNAEREVTDRKDGRKKKVSAFLYLLRALGFGGALTKNIDYATALQMYGGHYFTADWGWSANCSEKRDIYKDGAVVKGRSGCGQRYGLKGRSYKDRNGKVVQIVGIPRADDQTFTENFQCFGKRADGSRCDANIFVNGEISNFKGIPKAEEGAA
jgi:hypothetical protein